MKSAAFVLTLAGLAVAAAAGVAADRYAAAQSARSGREEMESRLQKAVLLAHEHPRAFGSDSGAPPRDFSLKSLVQDSAANRSVTIGYLSENDRELDRGRRERQVIVRLVQVPHAGLVQFLQDLESKGAGARVKEIHARPSRDGGDAYEEAEIVLSRLGAAREEKKP